MSSMDLQTPSSNVPSSQTETVLQTSTAFVEDYIALLSDSEEAQQPKNENDQGKESMRDALPTNNERERDQGKVRERSRGRGGEPMKKRKHDAIDFEDGYANKKQRMNAASRKAPWVYDVEWEECRNVAEM